MQQLTTAIAKEKALKPILGKHPWVYSDALISTPERASAGDIVDLVDADGNFLGRGFYNPDSQIAIRILSFDDVECGSDLVRSRLQRAIELRKSIPEYDQITCWRIVHAEADLLPGLELDMYSGHVNVRFHSAGWETLKSDLIDMIAEMTECNSIWDGSDPEIRAREGLETENKLLYGTEPPELVLVSELGRRFRIDIRKGRESEQYLIQKFNHQDILRYAKNRRVLDAFCYTGGFGIAALEAGCSDLTCVEISDAAIRVLETNVQLNRFSNASVTIKAGDAFDILGELSEAGERFDMIILDPPAFCRSRSTVVRACRAYKDINSMAMRLLNSEGILVTCSNSRPVTGEMFVRALWQAAVEAGRDVQLLKLTSQSPDFPVLLTFPESNWLTCATLIVR